MRMHRGGDTLMNPLMAVAVAAAAVPYYKAL
jgi:hypothetical protein